MTQNQIRFLELQEAKRANLAKEQENIRTNVARETETERSNKENERLAREKLEYDKYGKDPVGQAVRTIKSGLSELGAGNAADNPKPIGYSKTVDPTTGREVDSISIGGMNQGSTKARNEQRKEWMRMKRADFFAYYDKVQSGAESLSPAMLEVLESVAETRRYSF